MTALWTSEEAQGATLGIPGRAFEVNGLSIDTRTIRPGDLFVALKGENRDGHDFVQAAFDAKAGAALVSHEPPGLGRDAALLTVATPSAASKTSRSRHGRGLRPGSSRSPAASQDDDQGIAARRARSAGQHPCLGRVLQQPLGRAAQPRRPAARREIWRVRGRHEPFRRAADSRRLRPPACRPGHRHRAGASGILRLLRGHRRRQVGDLRWPAARRRRVDPVRQPYADRLVARARQAHVARILTFGARGGDARPARL
ncbi:MAG: Mur ligase domain-containing protein [Rhizomicrobium sp.]